MGLDVWLEGPEGTDTDLPSERHPDHLFRIGYWRSSYNEAGFNHVVGDRIGLTLWDFGGPEDPDVNYLTTPDWEGIIEDAAQAKRDLQDWALTHPNIGVTTESPLNMFEEVHPELTQAEAMEVYSKVVADRKDGDFPSFSNKDGSFFLNGLKVLACIRGTDVFNKPAIHMVFEQPEDYLDFYLAALDIIGETAEWVLNQPNPEAYQLGWSG